MSLNALAVAANQAISADCPVVGSLLSDVGKALYFPKGILTQSAEAKTKATRYNATIGIATEGGSPMYLDCVHHHYNDLEPQDIYPYAPSSGKPALRSAWADKQREETPSLNGHLCSLPVVTNALTHGLALIGELFMNRGDTILMPDKLWGNYRLTWDVRLGANIRTYPFFTDDLTAFNSAALSEALAAEQGKKVIVVLNFPNNPSGYSPLKSEALAIIAALKASAEAGTQIIAICDDAYYGMFYDAECATESLFGALAQLHENVLAIKVDGATKEEFVWGLRVGFLTYGVKGGTAAAYKALEQKTAGAIRGSISNVNHPGQSIVLKALESGDFRSQQASKVALLQERALTTQVECSKPAYADCWDVYPFNAGYFMCLRIKGVDADTLRLHLLEVHGLGAISLGATDLRIAFSCLENEQIADVFKRIAEGVRTLRVSTSA